MIPTLNPTRRQMVTALAVTPATLTVPVAAVAATPDPVMSAHKRYKMTFHACEASTGSYDAYSEAHDDLMRTKPTTPQGMAVQLQHALESGLCGETYGNGADLVMFENIIATLRAMQ